MQTIKNDEYEVFSDLGDLLIETSSYESLGFFLKHVIETSLWPDLFGY